MLLSRSVAVCLSYKCYCMSTSAWLASGHNKWSKVKRQKEVADPKRSAVFGRLCKEIAMTIRIHGGPDPSLNSSLARAVAKAKDAGVPKSTIQNCIRSASEKSSNGEHVTYEARGRAGILLMIETFTDNKRRTRPELRRIMEERGGLLGEPGSSSYNFTKCSLVSAVGSGDLLHRDPLEVAVECGADDYIEDNSCTIQLLCDLTNQRGVSQAAELLGMEITKVTVKFVPKATVGLAEDDYEKATALVEALRSQDDVIEVHDNFYCEDKI